ESAAGAKLFVHDLRELVEGSRRNPRQDDPVVFVETLEYDAVRPAGQRLQLLLHARGDVGADGDPVGLLRSLGDGRRAGEGRGGEGEGGRDREERGSSAGGDGPTGRRAGGAIEQLTEHMAGDPIS